MEASSLRTCLLRLYQFFLRQGEDREGSVSSVSCFHPGQSVRDLWWAKCHRGRESLGLPPWQGHSVSSHRDISPLLSLLVVEANVISALPGTKNLKDSFHGPDLCFCGLGFETNNSVLLSRLLSKLWEVPPQGLELWELYGCFTTLCPLPGLIGHAC